MVLKEKLNNFTIKEFLYTNNSYEDKIKNIFMELNKMLQDYIHDSDFYVKVFSYGTYDINYSILYKEKPLRPISNIPDNMIPLEKVLKECKCQKTNKPIIYI